MKRKLPTGAKESPAETNASDTALRTPTQENFVHHSFPHDFVHRLHATAGNRETGCWLQAKLKIGAPNDPCEREAERIAENMTAVDSGSPTISQASASQFAVRRKCSSCEDEDKEIHRKPAEGLRSRTPPSLEESMSSMRDGGEPLAHDVRQQFEQLFSSDFSGVRVHKDPEAAHAAQSIDSLAFTIGQDIAFAPGQYAPGTFAGKKLLAHELTHVVQQQNVEPSMAGERPSADPHDSHAEQEARSAAESLPDGKGGSAVNVRPASRFTSPVISRADPQVVNIGMSLGTTPRSGLQFWPTNVVDTRVGPINGQRGPSSGGTRQLHVIVAQNETIRRLARQLLPFFLTATPFTPPGAGAPLPLPIISETQLAQALLVYNQYYLPVSTMANWRAGLNFPLPIEIDPGTGIATLNPTLISDLAASFSPAWIPLLDSLCAGAVPPPHAIVQADVASFLVTQPTAHDRGGHLAARALTNAEVELPYVRETVRQLGAGAFDFALSFIDSLVDTEVQQLAAQRDGAAILTEIRTALAAPPRPPNATQQASLARANGMLAGAAGVVAVAPPVAARTRAEKAVTVDTVKLDGSNHDPAVDVAVASAIFSQCNVRFIHGINATASNAQTTGWLGGNTDLRVNPVCGSPGAEERRLIRGATAQFGLTGRIRAFFVASYSNYPGSLAYSFPVYCATGAAAPLAGSVIIQNASWKDDLAHESVHVLRNSPQHLPNPNLMGTSPVATQLNDAQCTDIYNKS